MYINLGKKYNIDLDFINLRGTYTKKKNIINLYDYNFIYTRQYFVQILKKYQIPIDFLLI